MSLNFFHKVIAANHTQHLPVSDSDRKAFLAAAKDSDFAIVEQLYLQNPAIIESQTKSKHWNSLHYAAATGNLLLVQFLLSNGLDPLRQTIDGKTAIQIAEDNHHSDIAQCLKKKAEELAEIKRQIRWNMFGGLVEDIKNLALEENKTLPSCYIMYAWGNTEHEAWVTRFAKHLHDAGITMRFDRWHNLHTGKVSDFTEKIGEIDAVIVIGTPLMKEKISAADTNHVLQKEAELLDGRMTYHRPFRKRVFPILLEGTKHESFHSTLNSQDIVFTDLSDGRDETYFSQFIDVVGKLYQFEQPHEKFSEIQQRLQQNLGKVSILPNYTLDKYKSEQYKINETNNHNKQNVVKELLADSPLFLTIGDGSHAIGSVSSVSGPSVGVVSSQSGSAIGAMYGNQTINNAVLLSEKAKREKIYVFLVTRQISYIEKISNMFNIEPGQLDQIGKQILTRNYNRLKSYWGYLGFNNSDIPNIENFTATTRHDLCFALINKFPDIRFILFLARATSQLFMDTLAMTKIEDREKKISFLKSSDEAKIEIRKILTAENISTEISEKWIDICTKSATSSDKETETETETETEIEIDDYFCQLVRESYL